MYLSTKSNIATTTKKPPASFVIATALPNGLITSKSPKITVKIPITKAPIHLVVILFKLKLKTVFKIPLITKYTHLLLHYSLVVIHLHSSTLQEFQ